MQRASCKWLILSLKDGAHMKKEKIYKLHSFQEGLLFLGLSVFLLIYSFYKHYTGLKVEWKMSPYLFPILVATLLLALSVSLLSEAVKKHKRGETDAANTEYFNIKVFFLTLALAVLYFVVLHYVPFVITTVFFLAALLLLFNERRWWMIALISVLTTLVIYLVFSVGLHVNLP